ICDVLAPLANRIFLTPVSSERTADPEQLQHACRKANPAADITVCGCLSDALEAAEDGPFVLITGSLYLVGEALERLQSPAVTLTHERFLNEWALTTNTKYENLHPRRHL